MDVNKEPSVEIQKVAKKSEKHDINMCGLNISVHDSIFDFFLDKHIHMCVGVCEKRQSIFLQKVCDGAII